MFYFFHSFGLLALLAFEFNNHTHGLTGLVIKQHIRGGIQHWNLYPCC